MSIFLEPICSHDLSTTCEKFYHEIPTTMFIIFFSLLHQQRASASRLHGGRRQKKKLEQEKREKGDMKHAAERERRG